MTELLGVTVPSYPYPDQTEPACLFCCNFLLSREQGSSDVYRNPPEGQTPMEFLMDTAHSLSLQQQAVGEVIRPGDMIVIYKDEKLPANIVHALIAIEEHIWFGANNRAFLQEVLPRRALWMLQERDGISSYPLKPDTANGRIGKFHYELWRR